MNGMVRWTTVVLCVLAGLSVSRAQAEGEKYLLRYRFEPGQSLRWEVAHRVSIRTSVSGTSKTAETDSRSVKAWRVGEVQPDGTATFDHLVEYVDMRQKLTGCEAVHYDSRRHPEPPEGFRHVAQSVGVTLSVVTMDGCGKIVHRERKEVKAQAKSEGPMTIPLPEEPIAVGHTWSYPQQIDVQLNTGLLKKVKARQTFTLECVRTGVATIRVATRILTPISDPAVESQLIQRETAGIVRFDINAGRVLSQQMDVDKHVVGFRGRASSLHYVTRFTERLLPATDRIARRQ